jgi:osmotically-inducible protein OsmY
LTDEDIDVADVEVRVSSGEVTLSGTVPDRRTKREIESIVDGVSG